MVLRLVHIHKNMAVPLYCSVNKDKDFEGDDLFQYIINHKFWDN